jgi:hypothetical protein
VRLQHVVAEDGGKAVRQRTEIGGFEQRQRLLIHLDHADAARAFGDAPHVLADMRAQIGHALLAPRFEQRLHAAEVF